MNSSHLPNNLAKLPTFWLIISLVLDPICPQNYQVFSSNDRSINYVSNGGTPLCDNFITQGWYRFMGAAGTKMSTSVVPDHHCNTHASSWLTGAHPSVADGIVSRRVCFGWSGNSCYGAMNIRMVNCYSFYLYELSSTPYCSLRFCAAP